MTREQAAMLLRNAYRSGPVPPLREAVEPLDAAGAYAIQALNTRFWEAQGRRVVGHKIGLTSPAVQAQLGIGQPDYGVLFADMAIEPGGELPAARVIQPKAEAEVAIVLERDLLDADAGPDAVARAAAYAMVAIEVVDSRIAEWKITFADTVADNGSSAFFVLGRERRLLDGLDLLACGMALSVNGEVASVGSGAACLGHPLQAAAWLVRTLSANGVGLKAGDVILTGALGPMVPVQPGDAVEARVDGLGAVGFRHGAAPQA